MNSFAWMSWFAGAMVVAVPSWALPETVQSEPHRATPPSPIDVAAGAQPEAAATATPAATVGRDAAPAIPTASSTPLSEPAPLPSQPIATATPLLAPMRTEPWPDQTPTPSPRSGSLAASTWFITVDRLTTLGGWSMQYHGDDGVTYTENGTQSTLIGGGATTGAAIPINPVGVPRFALDRRIVGDVTLGLGLSVFSQSGHLDAEKAGASASMDGQKSWLVSLSPRIGYLRSWNEWFGIWCRGGISWSQQHIGNQLASTDTKLGALDLELVWLFRVIDHVGIAAAFDLGLPIGGITTNDFDATYAQRLGLAAHHIERNVDLTTFALQMGLSGDL